ncbi:MAG: hypothetical protein IJ218_01555 [Alphaproteobacteria bacterium]|nr:hypothetical protein [Alphaproteobacteria bacterium]
MQIIKILLMVFSLTLGGTIPALCASVNSDTVSAQEMPHKHKHRKPQHHRRMSMAMMEDLNLSAEQKAKWKEISAQKKAELKPLRAQLKSLREQEMQINKKYEAKIKKILNAEQAEKYESMLPEPPAKPRKK